MKFAKQLESNATPEWRGKYCDYRKGKKKVKAVVRALRSVPAQRVESATGRSGTPGSSLRDAPVLSLLRRRQTGRSAASTSGEQPQAIRHVRTHSDSFAAVSSQGRAPSPQPSAPRPVINERSPLQTNRHQGLGDGMTSYGSIIGSPPHSPAVLRKTYTAPSLELPAPAVPASVPEDIAIADENPASSASVPPLAHHSRERQASAASLHPPSTQLAHTGNAYQIQPPTDAAQSSETPSHSRLRDLLVKRNNSSHERPFMRRMFSAAGSPSPFTSRKNDDVALEAYREVDFRIADFYLFLDKELDKIDDFHREKEEQAETRLGQIRQNLHYMRERRIEEIIADEQRRQNNAEEGANGHTAVSKSDTNGDLHAVRSGSVVPEWISSPIAKSLNAAYSVAERVRPGHVGKTSRAMGQLGSPVQRARDGDPGRTAEDTRRDYGRKRQEVSYRVAKKKMKLAMIEYYRSLELTKDYATVNRTAFRKITKKFTKRTGIPTKYMDEKVDKSHFVTSEVVGRLMSDTVDMYARYFERGNRKLAISKLQKKTLNPEEFTGPAFRTGLFLGTGTVLGVIGLVNAAELLFKPTPEYSTATTSYLLQLYGGYFMILFMVFLFGGCIFVFQKTRVNYGFIFELERRKALDWHQFFEIPSWFYLFLGLALFFNFTLRLGGPAMYTYWFVVLSGLATVLIFLPAPIFFAQQRLWLLRTLGRLVLSGFYAVEFRDLFLGDVFCSLTYATGNISLFFCLYAHGFDNPSQCNSSNSRLLGFFSALPGVWRALQCLRRYWDTRESIPHLANALKYTLTILQYMTLSLYRMNQTSTPTFALFLASASLNSLYCTFWDLQMDWYLYDLQTASLRKTLVYKKYRWSYYLAMLLDPLLRCNWIFYAIFTRDAQHSTLVSFFVSLSEVLRRGGWTLFRLENEQATNIEKMRASKDLPLPYDLPTGGIEDEDDDSVATPPPTASSTHDGTAKHFDRGSGVERAATSPVQTFLRRVGSEMKQAHARDYERRKPRDEVFAEDEDGDEDDDEDSDDE